MLSLCDGQFNTKSRFSGVYYIELGTGYDNDYFVNKHYIPLYYWLRVMPKIVHLADCVQFIVILH